MKLLKSLAAVVVTTALFAGCAAAAPTASGSATEGPEVTTEAPTGETPAAVAGPDQIVIGTQNLADPESIARAEGWLEEAFDAPVDIRVFQSGRDVVTAMAAGSIDFGLVGSVPAALAIGRDIGAEVIYIQAVLGDVESLVVADGSGITSAADLVGRRVATTFASTAHYSLLKYLEYNNVDATSVELMDLPPNAAVAAFIRGDVDAVFTWEPQVSELINHGGTAITSARVIGEKGYPTMDVSIVRSEFAEAHPEAVAEFIRVMDRSVMLLQEDPTAAGEALSQILGLTPEQALAQVRSSTWLTVDEQLGDDWFGTTTLAHALFDTAEFLYTQGEFASTPMEQAFIDGTNGRFLQLARDGQ